MNMTYQDSQKLGINATFWYQYTATPYDLLGVQWNPSDPGLSDMWDTMRSSGVPAIAGPSFRDSGFGIRGSKLQKLLYTCGVRLQWPKAQRYRHLRHATDVHEFHQRVLRECEYEDFDSVRQQL